MKLTLAHEFKNIIDCNPYLSSTSLQHACIVRFGDDGVTLLRLSGTLLYQLRGM